MKIERLQYISQQNERFNHLEAIQKALNAGCRWIQLRVKNAPEAEVRMLAKQAKVLCGQYQAKLIINDYPHIALEVGADGVHLGLLDMPLVQAREIVGAQMLIGGTANTFQHVLQRVREGANYIGLGPLRFTKTKEKLSPIVGLDGYREIMRQLKEASLEIPVVAIGAVTVEDIEPLMDTGLYGVAISGAITDSIDAPGLVNEIYKKFEKAGASQESFIA